MSPDFLLEWTAALAGLTWVVLTALRRIACWPVGIVSVVLYAVFFFRIRLYADAGLQVFYVITGALGWWHWAKGGADGGRAQIQVLSGRQRAWIATLIVAAVPVGSVLLTRYTDASYPWLDTLVATMSIAAQLLLMRKFIDSWVLWIAVDVLSLALYGLKAAWVTFGLYALFLVLAMSGLVAWRHALARGERI